MRVLLQLTGTTGLVMHNVRLADKHDEFTKEIAALTDKGTNRTPVDDEEIERLEFFGGIYHDPEIGVYVPSWNIVRCLENAAKVTRQGANVIRSVIVTTDKVPLDYGARLKVPELWAKPEHRFRVPVGIQRGKVIRMRPIFRRWSLAFEAELVDTILDKDRLATIAADAGRVEGLGDARKLGYGRFSVELA